MKKKRLRFLLICALVAGLTGCGNNEKSAIGKVEKTEVTKTAEEGNMTDEPIENTLPIANGDVELTVYTFIKPGAQQVYKDLSEHPVVKIIEEETGLKLNFVHPPEGDDGTFFNTTIASGVLPDIIYNNFLTYPGGPEAAMEDGVILNMNDYIKKYASNYKSLMSTLPEEVMRRSVSDSGTIIRFGSIIQPEFLDGRIHVGLFIRRDLLNKYGMDMPKTVDDYTEFFKACKQDGISTPLALTKLTDYDWKKQNYIASAYGITHNGFYLDGDNHVRFSRIQPEYKAYLEQLNMWYQEGYITSDFLTATKQDAQKVFQSGNAGMTVGGNWETMTLNAVGKVANPEFDVIGVPYPRLKEDDILNYAKPLESINDKAYFISATCEHPVEAIRFMDYWYSEGARLLTAWGPGNEEYPTFDIVDGKRKVSTFMTDNPEYDYSIARDRFTLNNFQAMFDNEMEKQQYEPYPEKMETWENWAYNTTSDFRVPEMITPTVDENRELSSIMTAIDTYTDEMILKFIVGNEPLDNFNTFAETVKTMEIDRAIEIQQAAVDRYFAR